jgi:hypothetical protein
LTWNFSSREGFRAGAPLPRALDGWGQLYGGSRSFERLLTRAVKKSSRKLKHNATYFAA